MRLKVWERKRQLLAIHPAEKNTLYFFHLDDASFLVEEGRLYKSDQVSKNILRRLTRYDRKALQLYWGAKTPQCD